MLERLLFLVYVFGIAHSAVVEGISVQAHATGNAAPPGQTSLRVEDGVAALSSLDKLRVLLLEDFEVALSIPVPWAVSGEEKVHFLKSALVGLRVQSPHHGNGDEIGGGEDVVCLFVESLEHDGAEECEPAIAHGPADDTPGVTLSTDLEREDLSGVEPWDGKPGSTEGCCEEEDHSDSAVGQRLGHGGAKRVLLTEVREDTGEQKRETLDNRAPVESPATANAIEGEDTDKCGKHVGDGIKTGDPGNILVGDTSSAEDGGSVDSDTSNTDPLLHDLKPDNELNATTSVELARAETEKHSDVGLARGSLAFELADVADILEFSFGLTKILAGFTTKPTQDVASFLLTTDLCEPTWGFGEHPHNGEEKEKRNDLECNGEAPDERRLAIHVE